MKSLILAMFLLQSPNVLLDSSIVFRSHGYDFFISEIPLDYKSHIVISGSCSTIILEYKDSSQIYISTGHEFSPNMRNITLAQPSAESLFRINWYLNMVMYEELFLSTNSDSATITFLDSPHTYENTMREFLLIGADTIDLCGKDANGLCWRDIITPNGFCYGYLNVDESLRQHFDKAISTVTRTSKVENFSGQIYLDQ